MRNKHLSVIAAAALAVGGLSFVVSPSTALGQADAPSSGAQQQAMPMDPTMDQTTGGKGTTADINGAQIHYETFGHGPAIILIHGYPLSSGLFREQVKPLSKDHTLVLMDLRGFGQSKTPNDDGSLKTYARDVMSLMDHLKIKKAIIGGHSMGGMTAIELYKMAPERFNGLILIDTSAKPAPMPKADLWEGMGDMAEKKGVASLIPLLVPNMLTGETRMNDKSKVQYLESLVKQTSVKGAEGGAEALAKRPDNSQVLGTIKVPTLILVGIEDTITPVKMAKEMNQKIAGSKLVVIKGASHASVLEQPDKANQAIEQFAQSVMAMNNGGQGGQPGEAQPAAAQQP